MPKKAKVSEEEVKVIVLGYGELVRTIDNLKKAKDPRTIINGLVAASVKIESIVEDLQEIGMGGLAGEYLTLHRKVRTLSNKVHEKEIKTITAFQKELKLLAKEVDGLDPKIEQKDDAGIDIDFKALGMKEVKLSVEKGKIMALTRASMLIVTGAPLKAVHKKLLTAMEAKQISGVNAIIMEVPLLVLNMEMVDERQVETTIGSILETLFKTKAEAPVPFYDYAYESGKYFAVPCIKPTLVEAFHSLMNISENVELKVKE